MTPSLQSRLLLVATIILAAFLGITGLVLNNAFHESTETALKDRLQSYVYGLLAAADVDTNGTIMVSEKLPDPRLKIPDSGLYAFIADVKNREVWRSPSAISVNIVLPAPAEPGTSVFVLGRSTNSGKPTLSLSYSVEWDIANAESQHYHFFVATELESFNAQIRRFRNSLWIWLGAAGALLLFAQLLVLRWGLTPLRQVAKDLEKIETGQSQTLSGNYPKELTGLTNNINQLINNANNHLGRYRDALGNLAHSLKTPLAVLRGAVDNDSDSTTLRETAKEQLETMHQIIDYQLQRAATSGRNTLKTIQVSPVTNKVLAALEKVYAEKHIHCEVAVADNVVFHGDEGDLLEVLGNLLDNAFKWCRSSVRVSAINSNQGNHSRAIITIEDDGPGITESDIEKLLKRGQRGDMSTDGHGIGLAMVSETVRIYQGDITITKSLSLGGTLIKITL
ncbi:MAG: ATP-binding protein [Gammaproteobacteria bacterium]|nr:ATP-binding protein [Gammaproteobacteria bacterium]